MVHVLSFLFPGTGPSVDARSPPPDKSPSLPSARRQWCFEYESGSDSEPDRPDPDLVTDDLASRRFRNPSPAPPANFSVPVGPSVKAPGGPRAGVAPSRRIAGSSGDAEEDRPTRRPPVSTVSLFSDPYPESEDEDDEVGYADPVQDDLYARKVGVRPTAAGDASHHKFLPKLWTPEEDVHVQKIQRGSQKGAWYKKMQGFSQEKSGSSSDDSEPGVPPPCQLGVSRPRPFTARSAVVVEKSPPLPAESTPIARPPAAFAPADPTSGPRLVKCQRWPLLGRQDPREPPDPIDYESIIPDLENDDMFARRTLAFQSNDELAAAKTPLAPQRRLWTSEEQINIVTRPDREKEDEFPDIERDDVVQRREETQLRTRPPSGAPDSFSPMAVPEPWDLPPELQARLLCPPRPLAQGSRDDEAGPGRKEPCPETDDMLVRKLAVQREKASDKRAGPSAPASCSEVDLQRWRDIREASQRRHKKKLMVEMLKALKL
ncbi:LIM domain only protein 7-like isoform X1 [Stigmatopora argus]